MGQVHSIKHMGIYVDNLNKMTDFYEALGFSKLVQYYDSGKHIEQLLKEKDVRVQICKLLTPYGQEKGQGDMLELIECQYKNIAEKKEVFFIGVSHLALKVDNIYEICKKACEKGGEVLFPPIKVNESENYMAFCRDPEGNYLEFIQNGEGLS